MSARPGVLEVENNSLRQRLAEAEAGAAAMRTYLFRSGGHMVDEDEHGLLARHGKTCAGCMTLLPDAGRAVIEKLAAADELADFVDHWTQCHDEECPAVSRPLGACDCGADVFNEARGAALAAYRSKPGAP